MKFCMFAKSSIKTACIKKRTRRNYLMETMPMEIRHAIEADLPGILVIYNDVIANSTAVYTEQPVSLENRREWFQSRLASGFPVVVATDETGVMGFASFGDFRAWPCYRYTVEHSIHVHQDKRGKGIGKQLLNELIIRAIEMKKHAIVGGVDSSNEASLRLHEGLGFKRVAHFKEVGRKFERWLDLIFVELILPGAPE
jgi:L-amino acid N-acyltransferase YncA